MHNPHFLVLTVIFLCLVIQLVVLAKPSSASGFSVELIHRDSPLSPFYNSSLTTSEIVEKNALHSMNRIKAFQSLIDQDAADIQSVVIPDGGSYLMTLSFGTPPVEYYAVADTGSDLIWIQCFPCPKCYSQDSSLFDPKSSSTYRKLSCDAETCQKNTRVTQCLNTNDCGYHYKYGDGSTTNGILSTDTLSFQHLRYFPASIFGCGYNSQGNYDSASAGLVGLGGGPLSLVSQLGAQIDHRFSYCLVPRSATSSSSKLNFGQEAIISLPGAVSTPLIPVNPPTFYVLSLEGVSIGDKTVQPSSSTGKIDVVIDSGTTLTILEPNLYNGLENMVKGAIGSQPVQDPQGRYSLCYGAETNINIPEMVFHFRGASLRLQPVNTFRFIRNMLCMAIVPSPNSLSIFGNYAQMNFLVEYDLQKRVVSFAPTDCTKQ